MSFELTVQLHSGFASMLQTIERDSVIAEDELWRIGWISIHVKGDDECEERSRRLDVDCGRFPLALMRVVYAEPEKGDRTIVVMEKSQKCGFESKPNPTNIVVAQAYTKGCHSICSTYQTLLL